MRIIRTTLTIFTLLVISLISTNINTNKVLADKTNSHFIISQLNIPKPSYLPGTDINSEQTDSQEQGQNNPKEELLNVFLPNISSLLYKWGIAIVLIMFVVGGLVMMLTAGDDTMAGKGKTTVIAASGGISLIVLGYTIINIIINLGDVL